MPLINLYFETKYIVIILNTFTSIGAELNDNIILYFITTVFNSIICFILSYFLEKKSKSEKEEEKMKSEYVSFAIEEKNIYIIMNQLYLQQFKVLFYIFVIK